MSTVESVRAPAVPARLSRSMAALGALIRGHIQQIRAGVSVVGAASLLGGLAAAAAVAATAPKVLEAQRLHEIAERIGGDLSDASLRRFTSDMDPAALRLAARYDPALDRPEPAPPWARAGAADAPPSNDVQQMSSTEAMLLNASIPFSLLPNAAARPFLLDADTPLAAAQALTCLSAAIYYEAASESDAGQAAVAQVVLNRLRHPLFPKTVCGVVFQGSQLKTGCQFTFTCDGSLGRRPDEAGWSRAERAAAKALAGSVMTQVGEATHYHTEWVFPYWSPSLVKLTKIGAHIFYRWNGAQGLPAAFAGVYAGDEATAWAGAEARLIKIGLTASAPEAAPAAPVEVAAAPEVQVQAMLIAPAPQIVQPRLVQGAPAAEVSVQALPFSTTVRDAPRAPARIAVPSNW